MSAGPLPAGALVADPPTAARRLLGARLTGRGVSAVVVEVEAYGGPPDGPWPDPASHAYIGPRPRTTVMFGSPGRLYAYRSYGIHVCANVVTGAAGQPAAALLRAARIDRGTARAAARRTTAAPAGLARGPGNLCAALGIALTDDGLDLFDAASPIRLEFGPAGAVRSGPRVGVSRAADRAWRFWLAGEPAVSAYRRSPRAPMPGAGGEPGGSDGP